MTQVIAARRQSITDQEIEHILALRDSQDSFKRRLDLIDKALNRAESQVMDKLIQDASLKQCSFALGIEEAERRFPAWKEHFIEYAGKDAADRVLADTKPKIYRRLKIG